MRRSSSLARSRLTREPTYRLAAMPQEVVFEAEAVEEPPTDEGEAVEEPARLPAPTPQRRQRSRRLLGRRQDPPRIIASRSFMVDVHILGDR